MNQKQHVLEQFPRDIEAIVAELGMPQFATTQILSWVYEQGVDSFDAMTNTPILALPREGERDLSSPPPRGRVREGVNSYGSVSG